MADTTSNTTIFESPRKLMIHLTNSSDGTGETDVIKVDKSLLRGTNGLEPAYLVIEEIKFSVTGMTVILEWDNGTDLEIATLNGYGHFKWLKEGGLLRKGNGGTGDLLLTTVGASSGDAYDITIYMRKKNS